MCQSPLTFNFSLRETKFHFKVPYVFHVNCLLEGSKIFSVLRTVQFQQMFNEITTGWGQSVYSFSILIQVNFFCASLFRWKYPWRSPFVNDCTNLTLKNVLLQTYFRGTCTAMLSQKENLDLYIQPQLFNTSWSQNAANSIKSTCKLRMSKKICSTVSKQIHCSCKPLQ